MEIWNKLPEEVIQVPTLSIFKARLDMYSHWTEIGYMDIVKGLWPNILLHCNLIVIIVFESLTSSYSNPSQILILLPYACMCLL